MNDTAWSRWAAVAGIVFVVLLIVGVVLISDQPNSDASDQEIVSYLDDTGVHVRNIIGLYLWVLAGASFLGFLSHLRTTLRIPLIAVCHGVPPLSEEFFGREDRVPEWPAPAPEVNEIERQRLVDFLGDILVVCNSHQAAKEWQFKKSTVIWHGFDPSEYPSATYRRSVLTVARGVRRRPYYRGYALYNEVTRGLDCDILGDDMPNTVSVPEPAYDDTRPNEYAYKKFRNYVDLIRQYSIFFNPTLRSCMPRSRAEAMLCGLAVVTANNHDVDRFLRNGVDGFYSSEAAELRHFLEYCIKNPRAAKRVGQAGSETAARAFHYQRFLEAWQAIIHDAIG